ncbi:hypothetical protein [Burkholderia anthina]|uniref:hypothetical protein n=1 Tax=Burkholderia anthina TaxID=179879 RepID=UPI0037BE701E
MAQIYFARSGSLLLCAQQCEASHPNWLRRWFRDQQANTPPAPEVDLSTSPAPRPRLTIETAKKVNKLVAMSQSGEGQEQETAKKYLKKQAEKFGMKPEELSELASKTDPTIQLTREVVIALLDQVCDQLQVI